MTTKCTSAAPRPYAAGDFAAGLLNTFAKFVSTPVQLLSEWQRRAEERQHIRQLDDRLLRDMGLRRIDALAEADKPFWQA